MNPVNGYLGPFIEEAFAEAIGEAFWQWDMEVEEGRIWRSTPDIDEIHLPVPSGRTIGHVGPERAERRREGRNEPLACR
jgi:hypothetical protein